MYTRLLHLPRDSSFFLFGPRGTGKTTWLKERLPKARYIDLLHTETYNALLANPSRLEGMIPDRWNDWVIIDEVQRVPQLLNEVHRLIESRRLRFAITGSSARKLRRGEANLLAGRALTLQMHPLTVAELGKDFSLWHALHLGHLPLTFSHSAPRNYLNTYVTTYLREEIQQEGLTRDLAAFARFLEVASFSQGQLLNIAAVAREAALDRKMVEGYFSILDDLLIAFRLPVFTKRAKRKTIAHRKFFFFDAGVYRTIRPRGPLDSDADLDGAGLETLVAQELRAVNHYYDLGYQLYFWRAQDGKEVDSILYGERGLIALEVKRSDRVTDDILSGLLAFKKDYPVARCYLLHGGSHDGWERNIRIMPVENFLKNIVRELAPKP